MSERRIIVLGSTGMLGHTLLNTLSSNGAYECLGSYRRNEDQWRLQKLFPNAKFVPLLELNYPSLVACLNECRADTIINCIGFIKQKESQGSVAEMYNVNSLFPHIVARAAASVSASVIHFSTDCVYSGAIGNYSERDIPDPIDLYGMSKLYGELHYPGTLTLRTSIIGHELFGGSNGLLEWFLCQKGTVKGFTNAIFSGLTTNALSRFILDYILPERSIHGLYHISSTPIAKYDLLKMISNVYQTDSSIVPSSEPSLNRSLDSTKLSTLTGYRPPSWADMLHEMFSSKYND